MHRLCRNAGRVSVRVEGQQPGALASSRWTWRRRPRTASQDRRGGCRSAASDSRSVGSTGRCSGQGLSPARSRRPGSRTPTASRTGCRTHGRRAGRSAATPTGSTGCRRPCIRPRGTTPARCTARRPGRRWRGGWDARAPRHVAPARWRSGLPVATRRSSAGTRRGMTRRTSCRGARAWRRPRTGT